MSYSTWHTTGFGFNATQITDSFKNTTDTNEIKAVLVLIDSYIQNDSDANEYMSDHYPDIMSKIHDATYDDDVLNAIDGEDIVNELYEYEGNEMTTTGFDQLLIDALNHKWANDGHDRIETAVADEFGDGCTYWLLETVYPWHRCEFASQSDCERTIRNCFGSILNGIDLEKISIENGG